MAQGDVRQIEQRRPVRRARVDDFEHGLYVSIQINGRSRAALECQWLILLIPPSMWYAVREPHGLAGPCVDTLATGHHREGAGGDPSLFILEVMNVQGRAF